MHFMYLKSLASDDLNFSANLNLKIKHLKSRLSIHILINSTTTYMLTSSMRKINNRSHLI
jgi:hypothetical protein